jgi:hypothetical protein
MFPSAYGPTSSLVCRVVLYRNHVCRRVMCRNRVNRVNRVLSGERWRVGEMPERAECAVPTPRTARVWKPEGVN